MIILLVGQKGSGKTTVAMNLAKRLVQAGILVGGVICPGIYEQNRKTGIKIHYPASGHEKLLGMERSSVGKPAPETTGPDTFSYGRWEFRRSALAAADASILKDIGTSPFVFVDEIGPLELDHGIGMSQTLARLDADKDINNCAILVCARQDLVQALTARWPGSSLVELTGEGPAAILRAEETILTAVGV
ncbi:MAG: nucleoside-triphosphatase [Spirochaetota bacterium]